jgi:hypothetical protein
MDWAVELVARHIPFSCALANPPQTNTDPTIAHNNLSYFILQGSHPNQSLSNLRRLSLR